MNEGQGKGAAVAVRRLVLFAAATFLFSPSPRALADPAREALFNQKKQLEQTKGRLEKKLEEMADDDPQKKDLEAQLQEVEYALKRVDAIAEGWDKEDEEYRKALEDLPNTTDEDERARLEAIIARYRERQRNHARDKSARWFRNWWRRSVAAAPTEAAKYRAYKAIEAAEKDGNPTNDRAVAQRELTDLLGYVRRRSGLPGSVATAVGNAILKAIRDLGTEKSIRDIRSTLDGDMIDALFP